MSTDEFIKLIVPVLLTGLGAMVFTLFKDISDIENKQMQSETWTYRIEQNEIKIEKLQESK